MRFIRTLPEDALDVVPEPGAVARLCEIERVRQLDGHPATGIALEVDRDRRPDKSGFRWHEGSLVHPKPVALEHSAKVRFVVQAGHAEHNDGPWPTEQSRYSGVFQPPTHSTSASASGGPHVPGSYSNIGLGP